MKILGAFTLFFLFWGCQSESDLLGPLNGKAPSSNNTPSPNAPAFWLVTSLPLDIKISNAFTGVEADQVVDVSEEWNKAVSYIPVFYQLQSATLTTNPSYPNLEGYEYDSEMGIYQSSTWFSNIGSSTLALTTSLGYRRMVGTPDEFIQLFHADIILNTRNHRFTLNSQSGTYDMPTVVLHELGHFLGLDHISDATSVMNPRLSANTQKKQLYPIDVQEIKDLYPISRHGPLSTDPRPEQRVPGEGEKVHILHELKTDGQCYRFENGIFMGVH